MATISYNPTDYTAENQSIERARQMAQAMQLQGMQPMSPGGMAGQVYVPASWTQGLAKLAQSYFGGQGMRQADEQAKGLADRRSAALAEAMGAMPRATPEQVAPSDGEGFQVQAGTTPTGQDYAGWMSRLASIDPQAAQLGQALMNSQIAQQERDDTRQFRGRELAATREFQAEQARLSREAQAQAQRDRAADQARRDQERAQDRQDQIRLAASLRPPSPGEPMESVVIDGKPVLVPRSQAAGKEPYNARAEQKKPAQIPTSALKLQQESLDAIGTAAGIVADLGAVKGQIESGDLKLGPVENVKSKAKNIIGLSDKNSQNFAAFRASLEKLRNDSLRLNKGVQTEGDAQRAWNELIANINDPAVVKTQIERIEKINERAVNLHQMNVENIRRNFGAEPLDTSGYANQPPSIGQGGGGFKVLGVEGK